MPLLAKDRVQETTTTTGTGALTLSGAVTGYQTFSSAIGNGNTCYYAIDGGSEWEVGLGTVSAGALSRDNVLASSNSGSLVNLSSGIKLVYCTYPADKSIYQDASGNVGIGLTSPTGKFEVATGGPTSITAALGGTFPAYTYRNGSGSWFHAGKHPSSDYFYIGHGATPTTTIDMVVDSSGRIGIGTSTPTNASLVVQASSTISAGNIIVNKFIGAAASPTESTDWPTPVLTLRGYGDFTQESMLSFGYSNDSPYQTGDAVWGFRLDGIASATSSSASTNLRLGGPGTLNIVAPITSTGNITAYFSDERLKTKLGGIENALEKVQSLSGFYYEANDVAQELGYKPKREVGVSAQEVQAVMPEVVSPAPIDDKYLTVDYERLVPLLIEAIKELKAEVDELKKGN